MIEFNRPIISEKGLSYIQESIRNNGKICGDGPFTKKCHQWLEENLKTPKALLTTSCTHALEMAALLINVQPGDEIIVPSFTFVSTVNAFVLRGGIMVFVDVRPDTMNIDETLIESAITTKTKAIVPVHYAGIACEMDAIMGIARKYNLYVIEDAAQGVMSNYKGKPLGTIGDFGCLSFHETKNYTMGEGGALLVNNEVFKERAEIMREKGTDRSRFLRGQIDKYSWVDMGSSFLPSDINAAYLYAQLADADNINNKRLALWNEYYKGLNEPNLLKCISLPVIPVDCVHNAHMFYIKCADIEVRTNLMSFLKGRGIQTVFHYIPLHTAQAGIKYGRFFGNDIYTTSDSERLLRLPLFFDLELDEVKVVTDAIKDFYDI